MATKHWARRRGESSIYVHDLDNTMRAFKVQADVTPEIILRELKHDDCYLVASGHIMTPKIIKKYLKDEQTFYVCKIKDSG